MTTSVNFGWFESILLFSVIGGFVWGGGAYYYSRSATYPRSVNAAGLTGTVKEFSKLAVTSGGAGLVAAVLADELEPYRFFQEAMLAVLIVALVGAIVSYFMGAALDPKTTDDKEIELTSRFWEVLHGYVFGSTFIAMVAVLIAVVCLAFQFRG